MCDSVARESCGWGWRSGSDPQTRRLKPWSGIGRREGALTSTYIREQAPREVGEGTENRGHRGPRKAREQRISGWEWPEAAVLPQKMTTKRVHRFSVNVSQGPRQVS